MYAGGVLENETQSFLRAGKFMEYCKLFCLAAFLFGSRIVFEKGVTSK